MSDSPLERELQVHLQLTRWDQRDVQVAAVAIHTAACTRAGCSHTIDDVDEQDLTRAHAAVAALRAVTGPL